MPRIDLTALPPAEAVRFFRRKGYAISFDWRDVWQEQHARAFTVAKAMTLDVLADIRAAVDDALANGKTLTQFQRELRPLLAEKGWWGRRTLVDPATGEARDVQLGSPRRLRTIFNVNLRTAYAAGKWEQIQRVKERRPFLRYLAVRDNRTRPEHLAWHDTVLPADDAWWNAHYPPNGWNCRCTVAQLSTRDVERFGLEVSERAPSSPTTRYVNKRTGEVVEVPRGVDPGFAYNVGRAANFPDPARYADDFIGHQAARLAVGSPDFKQFVEGKLDGAAPVGFVDARIARAIAARVRRVDLSDATIAKQAKAHPELSLDEYRLLPEIMARGLAIQDRPTRAPNMAVFFREKKRTYKLAIKSTGTGRALSVADFRRVENPEREIRRARASGRVIREAMDDDGK